MKKMLCLLLALMLCSASALAEMAGGWMIPEDTSMTDEALDAFIAAVSMDTDLSPNCLMGTQVVAGVNYAIMCASPYDAEVVYVYHNVSGEDTLMRRQVLVSYAADMAGAWNKLDDEEDADHALATFEAIFAAFDEMDGIGVSEIYILGQQVVAGTNYLVLCRKTVMTAEPVDGWALATVYVDLEGKASIIDMQDVVLSLTEE